MSRVVAHPNIALAKYWGKADGPGNHPAMPSLSVTLAGMSTRSEVSLIDGPRDVVVVNGQEVPERGLAKSIALFDRVRQEAGRSERFSVSSTNDFPTASGLASSASGFAALAVGARAAMGLPRDVSKESDLARRGSASAARSLFGGFAALPAGRGDDADLSAHQVAPESALPLVVLVAVVTEDAKSVSSTEGMQLTARESPYHAAWLVESARLFEGIAKAVVAGDLSQVGALAERSALAMHASMLACGLVYFREATLAALRTTHELRRRGVAAWATMDAGPHVKVLTSLEDEGRAASALAATPGVLRVLRTTPGPGASVEST